MRRRELILALGGAAAAWPLAARAQQPAMPVIGFLNSGSAVQWAHLVAAFRQGLNDSGYVEGRNLTIEYRWADDQIDNLSALAAELVRRHVAVIVASPLSATLAAKATTTTIPIVFQIGGDPIKLGFVASFNRPGGNFTGVSQLSTALIAKRLELLHDLAPKATVIAVLVDPQATNHEEQLTILQQAARALGLRTLILNRRDIDSVFANLVQQQAGALFVAASSYWVGHRDQIISLAARAGRYLYRANSQGREARRHACRAADQIRARH
jgi:ABC-type uncharacterized transport system substrate-binding protein